ncbi:hypothetical protein D7V88_41095, partial [Corallococcus terminator]
MMSRSGPVPTPTRPGTRVLLSSRSSTSEACGSTAAPRYTTGVGPEAPEGKVAEALTRRVEHSPGLSPGTD